MEMLNQIKLQQALPDTKHVRAVTRVLDSKLEMCSVYRKQLVLILLILFFTEDVKYAYLWMAIPTSMLKFANMA